MPLTSSQTGTIAGMSAHADRIEKDASELHARTLVLLKARAALTDEQAAKITHIQTFALNTSRDALNARLWAEQLDREINGKPELQIEKAIKAFQEMGVLPKTLPDSTSNRAPAVIDNLFD